MLFGDKNKTSFRIHILWRACRVRVGAHEARPLLEEKAAKWEKEKTLCVINVSHDKELAS